MKVSHLLAGAALAATIGAAGSGAAAVAYTNGPINGQVNAYTINFAYAVSDSFTLAKATTLTGVDFGAWLFPGDTMSSVDYAITTAPDTYPVDRTAATSNTYQFTNGYGYDIYTESFSLSQTLAAGTYYLVLQNAAASFGDPAYWDESDGPSTATQLTIGSIPSESFTIYGNVVGVPEPATWALMLTGFGLAGGALRRRKALAA